MLRIYPFNLFAGDAGAAGLLTPLLRLLVEQRRGKETRDYQREKEINGPTQEERGEEASEGKDPPGDQGRRKGI